MQCSIKRKRQSQSWHPLSPMIFFFSCVDVDRFVCLSAMLTTEALTSFAGSKPILLQTEINRSNTIFIMELLNIAKILLQIYV